MFSAGSWDGGPNTQTPRWWPRVKAGKVRLMLPTVTEGLRWLPTPRSPENRCVKARELPDNWDLVIYKTPKQFSNHHLHKGFSRWFSMSVPVKPS